MWTPTTREQDSRTALRYETDLTDPEWAVIEPHMPPARQAGAAARLDLSRDHQRHLLYPSWRHPLAADAHRSAALANRVSLVRGLARQRLVRDHQSRPGHDRPRAGRPRGKPERGDHRQP